MIKDPTEVPVSKGGEKIVDIEDLKIAFIDLNNRFNILSKMVVDLKNSSQDSLPYG